MDPHEIVKYPLMGEKATLLREKENVLTFVVAKDATKRQIRDAVAELFSVDVINVRVMHTLEGTKKAHVKLGGKHSADEIASQMGVI